MALGQGLPQQVDMDTQTLSGDVSSANSFNSYFLKATMRTATDALGMDQTFSITGEFNENGTVSMVDRTFSGPEAVQMQQHMKTASEKEIVSMARTMAMDSADKQLEHSFASEDRSNTLEMLDLQQTKKAAQALGAPPAKKSSSLDF